MRDAGGPPRQIDTPQPGYFEMRLVRGGPLVAACITFEGGLWRAWIDGEPQGAAEPDPVMASRVCDIWHSGVWIGADAYRYRLALKSWAQEHDPGHPIMHPKRSVDLAVRPSLF